MHKVHDISEFSLKGRHLNMVVDGKFYDIDLARESSRLANATQQQLEQVEVSPSGYGFSWTDLDEDLSVDGLIGVRHESVLLVAENRAKYGFTLLEVLVAMGILMIIVLMMATLFHQSSMAWNNGLRQAEMSIQARAAMSIMRRDLSQAVASEEYKCSFSGNGFTVFVLGTTDGDSRTISEVTYSGGGSTISRNVRELKPTNTVGNYGSPGSSKGGDFLDSVKDFKITTAPDWSGSSTNLPAWVDISITLEKKTIGAAGIKVWSKGRNIGSDAERKENVIKKRLFTCSKSELNSVW